MKTQTDKATARPNNAKVLLLSWVQGICCEDRHDHWKSELLEEMVNEHDALIKTEWGARQALMHLNAGRVQDAKKCLENTVRT